MIKLLIPFLFMLILSACQIEPDVSSSNQTSSTQDIANPNYQVGLPANGWKKFGDAISMSLIFPYPVTVTGSPYVNVTIGSSVRRLYYNSGSGTEAITFRYVVTNLDFDDNGITIANTITLNSGSMTYVNNAGSTLAAPTNLINPYHLIRVDGVKPLLTSVTGPGSGNLITGQNLDYQLTFTENVFVSGNILFYVTLNSGTVPVTYVSGSGSSALTFRRVITSGDADTNGFSTGTLLNIDPLNNLTIKDQSGNLISATIPVTTTAAGIINVAGPTVSSVTAPANGTYGNGMAMNFTVVFSQPVKVTGLPAIRMTLTSGQVLATYVSGTGTNTLILRHVVQNGEQDLNGITLSPTLDLNGGTITNIAQTVPAALPFSVPVTTAVNIDAIPAASVQFTSLPPNGMYLLGQNLDFTFHFNRNVIVSGVPQLQITLASGTVFASYVAGLSTATSLVFRYVTQLNDTDQDGINLLSPLLLNGGTIQDANGLAANLVYAVPSSSGIYVDTTPPVISSITPPPNGTYIPGVTMQVVLNFNEIVNVAGIPRVVLDPGIYANYASGSGTSSLTFEHVVATGEFSGGGINIASPLELNGGDIKDLQNQSIVDLTFAAPALPLVLVDATGPTISSVTAPIGATYKVGDQVDFTVNWSEPVAFSGVPRLEVDVGGTIVYATYVPVGAGSPSTNVASVFRYTVANNEIDSDGVSLSPSIQLNGGTIKDVYSNNAALGFAPPVLVTVLVDGVLPVTVTMTPPANGRYRIAQILNFSITWNEAVTITGVPSLNVIIGDQSVNATYNAGASTPTNTVFRYTVITNDLDTNGIVLNSSVYLNGGTIRDAAGNNATLVFTAPTMSGVLVDGILPTISTVTPPGNDTYKYLDHVDFLMSWNEHVVVLGVPRLTLSLNGVTVYANYYAAGSNSTQTAFRYTVANTQNDNNGIEVMPAAPLSPIIDANGGSIADLAGNSAVLTYVRPVLTGVLIDGIRPIITATVRPSDQLYLINQNLNFSFTWNDVVNVVGVPRVTFVMGSTTKYAEYFSGSGTNTLTFRYTNIQGDLDVDGITVSAGIDLNGGTIQDGIGNDAFLSHTAAGYWPNVRVNAIAPVILSVTSSGSSFKSGSYITYAVQYSETVVVAGAAPSFSIDIGGTPVNVPYSFGSGTSIIYFRYQIPAGNTLLDLNGIEVTSNINLNGGFMYDSIGNAADLDFTFAEFDYVHFSNIVARYHFSGNDYSVVNCGADSCLNYVKDISSSGNDITSGSVVGPVLGTGFGTAATSFAQFDNSSYLNLPNISGIRYALIVMKSNTTAHSADVTSSFYNILSNASGSRYFAHESSSLGQSQRFFTPTILKQNNTAPTVTTALTHTTPTWVADTTYIYQLQTTVGNAFSLTNTPRLGGPTFDGQIAEIIFFNSTATLSQVQLDLMQSQLNFIHGAY